MLNQHFLLVFSGAGGRRRAAAAQQQGNAGSGTESSRARGWRRSVWAQAVRWRRHGAGRAALGHRRRPVGDGGGSAQGPGGRVRVAAVRVGTGGGGVGWGKQRRAGGEGLG